MLQIHGNEVLVLSEVCSNVERIDVMGLTSLPFCDHHLKEQIVTLHSVYRARDFTIRPHEDLCEERLRREGGQPFAQRVNRFAHLKLRSTKMVIIRQRGYC
jgi:hypothetical protein